MLGSFFDIADTVLSSSHILPAFFCRFKCRRWTAFPSFSQTVAAKLTLIISPEKKRFLFLPDVDEKIERSPFWLGKHHQTWPRGTGDRAASSFFLSYGGRTCPSFSFGYSHPLSIAALYSSHNFPSQNRSNSLLRQTSLSVRQIRCEGNVPKVKADTFVVCGAQLGLIGCCKCVFPFDYVQHVRFISSFHLIIS